MKKSARLIFFGNERLATGVKLRNTPVLQSLLANNYDVAAVVANYEKPHSRSNRSLEIEQLAAEHNIPVLTPAKLVDIKEKLADYKADAGILVAYGKIIPAEIIDIFPAGIINIHPSELPKYRGPTPLESVILDGETKTAVSLMKLTPKMDAGSLYGQTLVKLTGAETKPELADRLLLIGRDLLIQKLPSILDGSLSPANQNEPMASYCKLITKADGEIKWDKPATQIEREIRAYSGWPKSQAKLFGKRIIVTKARVAKSQQDGKLVQACKDSWLEIIELVAPSGRKISGADFILGYQKK